MGYNALHFRSCSLLVGLERRPHREPIPFHSSLFLSYTSKAKLLVTWTFGMEDQAYWSQGDKVANALSFVKERSEILTKSQQKAS